MHKLAIKGREKWRFFAFFVASIFFLSTVSPSYAQRSIFRSVGDGKSNQKPATEGSPERSQGITSNRKTEDKGQGSERRKTSGPALDPLSLLGEREKTLAQAIQIPPELGRISETFEGQNPKPLVIHIQDVHVHYEAQKNLADILDNLTNEHGLRLILVEGGSGDTSLSFLRKEATKEKRLEVAEKYLKLGKISGEEYLDIVSDDPITLWGIEDEELYDKNLDIFFKVDGFKGEALQVAHGLKAIIEALKADIYSPLLKELENEKSDYEKGEKQAVDYYQYLGNLAQRHPVDLSRYANFRNFLDASTLEKHIDFQKVDGQHQALIGKLAQVLSKEDLTALAEKGLKYKLNEAGPAEYYGFLRDLLRKSDPAPGTHQDLDLYIEYILLYAERDHVELFREGRLLEKAIKESLYTSKDEKTLSEISDRLDLLLNFLELNLSPDDLKIYQANRQAFLIRGWKKFLMDKMAQYRVTLPFPKDTSMIDNNLDVMESFYEIGMARDGALVRNALTKIEEEGVDLAVLIAGGFHTAQITRLLKSENYSYMVIAPKITQASDLELYHEILKEKAKPAGAASDNLRQLPAIRRGAPGLLRGELRGGASDGGGRELTLEYVQEIVDSKLKVILGEVQVSGVHQIPIPRDKKVAVVQLKEWDPDFYAGNLIGAFSQKGNEVKRMPVDRSETGRKALGRLLRRFRPDVILLPLHEPALRENVENVLKVQGRSAIFIFYKSFEAQQRFNLIIPLPKQVASFKKKAIKAHRTQVGRIPYDLMAEKAGEAHAKEFQDLGITDTHAEIYESVTLQGGESVKPRRKVVWKARDFRRFAREQMPLLVIAAHPDDIAIMGGGMVYLAKHAGMAVQSWLLSTGSGADIPGKTRLEKAEIRADEERRAARWLGTDPPNLIGTDLLRKNPDLPDDEIVHLAAAQLKSNLKTFLGAYRQSGKIIVLINDPNDPHPRHSAVYEASIEVLKEFSKEEKGVELQLVYLAYPEGENFNGFFPSRTAIQIVDPKGEYTTQIEAARKSSEALSAIAREVVTLEGKGSRPRIGEGLFMEGVRIEAFDATAKDGDYKEVPFNQLRPGKDVLTESFSDARYAAYGLGEEIDVKGKVLARLYGYHYASFVHEKTKKEKITLIIAHDPRPTSKAIRDAQVVGFLEAGREKGFEIELVDLGIITTPLAEHAVRVLQVHGGMMITASHNPLKENGWKYLEGAEEQGTILLAHEMEEIIKDVKASYQAIQRENSTALLDRFDKTAKEIVPYHPDQAENIEIREAVIEDYIRFARKTFGLKEGERLVGKVVLDPNGGAATGIVKRILEGLGLEVVELESEPGHPKFEIIPDRNANPKRYRNLKAAMKNYEADIGMMFDFDADRGELGIGPQETSAFAVAMTLSDEDLKRKLKEGKTAIVMYDASNNRIREIAETFGAEVFEVETGEINVVSKMEDLRKAGYEVPIGVEGANGGAVFGESTSRDGLFTAILASRVLNDPKLYLNWLEKRSKFQGKELNPDRVAKIRRGDYDLQDVIKSFPRYLTRMHIFASFSMDHKEFKKAIKKRLIDALGPKGEDGTYTLKATGQKYVDYKIEYFDGKDIYPDIPDEDEEGLGGFKITLFDAKGNRTTLWMRGSRTEPQKMRYQVDAKFKKEARKEIAFFEDLLRSLEMERLGIQKEKGRIREKDARGRIRDYYVLEDGHRIEVTQDLSRWGYKILGDPKLVVGIEDAEVIGKGVVFDVSSGEGQIFILRGAKITGSSYLKASHEHSVVIGKGAEVDSSYLEGALVGDAASVSDSVLETTEEKAFDKWQFDRKGTFKASGQVTRIGERSSVKDATLINTATGKKTKIEGGVYKNSEIGDGNTLRHVKMSLIHTEKEVSLLGTPALPQEVNEAYIGYGFQSDRQAFIDSALHSNEVVSLRFDPVQGEFRLGERFRLPHMTDVGRNVIYSSYLGTLNPAKPHTHGLYDLVLDNQGNLRQVGIFGLDGTESSAHSYILVDPLSVVSPWLRWIARPGSAPTHDPFLNAIDSNLTHAMPFSVTGFPVSPKWALEAVDDWGTNPPGGFKFGLSKDNLQAPGVFTYSPDTVFTLMEKLRKKIGEGEMGRYDNLVQEMLETGRALLQRDLYELERIPVKDKKVQGRIDQLEKGIAAYERHIKSDAWRFQGGEKDSNWRRVEENWVHHELDLADLAYRTDGVARPEYRQFAYGDFLRKAPAYPFENWQTYEPVLESHHLPKLFAQWGVVHPGAVIGEGTWVHPSAVIGPNVRIGKNTAIGPGVILEGDTEIKDGAKIFGSHLQNSAVGEETFVWGSKLEYADVGKGGHLLRMHLSGSGPEKRTALGDFVELTAGRVENSQFRLGTKGEGFVSVDTEAGAHQLFEPYATVRGNTMDDSVAGVNRGIGSILVNSNVSGLFTNHHLAGRVYNLDALPVTYQDEEGRTHTVPNTTNVGGGSHVGRHDSTGRVVAESAFIGTNTIIETEGGETTHLGFGSIAAARVLAGEHLIPLTEKSGPGPKKDKIGAVLERHALVIRHLISKAKSAASDPKEVDGLMVAKIKEALQQAEEELTWVKAGQTHPPELSYPLHTAEQLKEGIEIFRKNLDGRWEMKDGYFSKGKWVHDVKANRYDFVQKARDGADRYVAKDREWLVAHSKIGALELFRRPASSALEETSRTLQDVKDAKFLIFHSSILKEDMGESFSLALDRLAEGTGNPKENEQSVFKIVLVIEEADVTGDNLRAYLARHNLRLEQFYALVTHEAISEYDAKSRGRWSHQKGLGKFLNEVAIDEENYLKGKKITYLYQRQDAQGDPNVVVVAPTPMANQWSQFIEWNKLKVKVVSYEPRSSRDPSSSELNLAPLLVTTAAEWVGAGNPRETLKDLRNHLEFLEHKIFITPVSVSPEYWHAFEAYDRQV